MSGVIAAGSEITAQAGAEMLAQGSGQPLMLLSLRPWLRPRANPHSPALQVAVSFSLVCESSDSYVVDCFGNAPGLGLKSEVDKDFFPVDLNFGPAVQRFYVGRASCGVPGVLLGLLKVHERWGKLPFKDVIAPACRYLKEGVAFGNYQTAAMNLLAPIL